MSTLDHSHWTYLCTLISQVITSCDSKYYPQVLSDFTTQKSNRHPGLKCQNPNWYSFFKELIFAAILPASKTKQNKNKNKKQKIKKAKSYLIFLADQAYLSANPSPLPSIPIQNISTTHHLHKSYPRKGHHRASLGYQKSLLISLPFQLAFLQSLLMTEDRSL